MRVGLNNLSMRILGSFPCKTLKMKTLYIFQGKSSAFQNI